LKNITAIDSKFRFVIVASKRAKQLLKGAKPKKKTKTKNLILIAQEEVEKGLIEYNLVTDQEEDGHEIGDDIFIGEKLKEEKP
jgi:DNA-directed RNA polymerase omega subunit